MWTKRRRGRVFTFSGAGGEEGTSPTPALLAEDGTIAWFTDPRAVITGGALFYSTVSGNTTGGNIELHRLQNGVRDTFMLAGKGGAEDHNNAAICVLSTGQLACFYSAHGDATGSHCRVSLGAAPDIGGFSSEFTITIPGGASYAHAFRLSDGNVYLIRRDTLLSGQGYQQQICIDSEANLIAGTATFSTQHYILWYAGDGTDDERPYAKYVQNGDDRIDIFTTNMHPGTGNGNAGLYHGYMQLVGGVLTMFTSDGTEIGAVSAGPYDTETSLTTVQVPTATNTNESWTWDVAIGSDGHPRGLSCRFPTNVVADNIEYWHHRWTGTEWINTRISEGNGHLPNVDTYAWGLCFDPDDPTIIYMSEGTTVGEINKYKFNETTATCTLTKAITTGSTHGNQRPFMPKGHGTDEPLLWSRASVYNDYNDYEADVYILGTVNERLPTPGAYETEALALFARMTTAPDTTRKNIINRRIKRLKNAPYSGSNLWDKKALDYVFMAHDEQAALLDWKNNSDAVKVGSPTITANIGWKGNGGTAYLTGPTVNTIGAPFTQNSGHICAFHSNAQGQLFGNGTSGPRVFMNAGNTGASTSTRVNSATNLTMTSLLHMGGLFYLTSVRTGATAAQVYREGGLDNSSTAASSALVTDTLVLGSNTSQYIHMQSVGGGLTADEVADLMFIDYEYYRDVAVAQIP